MNTEKINPEVMMRAMLLVLIDKRVETPVVFIHGSIDVSPEIDFHFIKTAVPENQKTFIILNGLTVDQSKEINVGYDGFKKVEEILVSSFGVMPENIIKTVPAFHTADECLKVIELMKEKGWDSITIVTHPHHVLRAMLQWVRSMEIQKVFFKVYVKTTTCFDWFIKTEKRLLGGGIEYGTLFDHIGFEYKRIEKYMNQEGGDFTPHATLPELIEYIQKRDC